MEALLSKLEAKELTVQISEAIENLWDLIGKAWVGRADIALGYPSWDVYCDTEFKNKPQLPKDERKTIIRAMQGLGMSTRKIAVAVGLGYGTVAREISDPNGSLKTEDYDDSEYFDNTPKPLVVDIFDFPDPVIHVGYAQPGITPDTTDPDRWGRGVTANILTSRTISQIRSVSEKLQDLPAENLRLVAKEGDLERWKQQLLEAVDNINRCLSITKD